MVFTGFIGVHTSGRQGIIVMSLLRIQFYHSVTLGRKPLQFVGSRFTCSILLWDLAFSDCSLVRCHPPRSSTNDVSRISYDASGRSTEQTRLSTDMSKNSTLVDSSILRHDRYQTDSTIPSASEIKTASTVLPNDRRSFATDHEIFGAIASKISSKHGSVTGKDTYAMSSRATSVGSLSPIIVSPQGNHTSITYSLLTCSYYTIFIDW